MDQGLSLLLIIIHLQEDGPSGGITTDTFTATTSSEKQSTTNSSRNGMEELLDSASDMLGKINNSTNSKDQQVNTKINSEETIDSQNTEVSSAWKSKFEQAYEKAKILFDGTEEFNKINELYNQKQQKIKNSQKALIWGVIICVLLALSSAFLPWIIGSLFN